MVNLSIVFFFEDNYLLIIDKPAGVAVHGGSGVSYGVIEQLRASRPDAKFLDKVVRLCGSWYQPLTTMFAKKGMMG